MGLTIAHLAVWVPLIVAVGMALLCLTARQPSKGRHWA